MKYVLVLLAMLVAAPLMAADYHDFSVTVTAAADSMGFRVYPPAGHIQMSTANDDVRFRAFHFDASSTDNRRLVRVPLVFKRLTQPTNPAQPDSAHNYIELIPSATLFWNVFNDMRVDSLFIWNASSTDATVRIQTKSD